MDLPQGRPDSTQNTMKHYRLTLKHPLFGFAVFEGGAFSETIIRAHAKKALGIGYKTITIEKVEK